ncbi:MAG: hypothetical protein ACI9E1_002160 [Cryomorphaceae bacterium]|jgi:hypothetical protein
MNAQITNALIRCTRTDRAARSEFELVHQDLGIWVRELPENLDRIIDDLSGIQQLLEKLKIDSSDYTLHLTATFDDSHSISLPIALSTLASRCGFTIELISSS